ncbi:ependymin-like [Salminus brasiliensis]|uniref:ependymin-like n=1 Tax=Salminus brasiliensis TaxID=930266 RepID=UPI003B832507
MKLLVLLSICSCLALNAWTEPTPCASPPLLVGSIAITGKEGTFTSAGQYEYDGVREQIRIRDFGIYDNKVFSVDLLMLFKEGVVYEIDTARSTCKKFALKSSFHPMRIPTNAKFLSEIVLGTSSLPDMGLPITTWEGEDTEIEAKYVLTFTANACLPVSAVIQTKEFGSITISFYNQLLTLHPTDFVPPSFCEAVPLEKLPGTDFFSVLNSAA